MYAHRAHELASTVRSMSAEMEAAAAGVDKEALGKRRQRLSALTLELLGVRVARDEQEFAERLLSRRMLELWKEIKKARRIPSSDCTCTPLALPLAIGPPPRHRPSPSPSPSPYPRTPPP